MIQYSLVKEVDIKILVGPFLLKGKKSDVIVLIAIWKKCTLSIEKKDIFLSIKFIIIITIIIIENNLHQLLV